MKEKREEERINMIKQIQIPNRIENEEEQEEYEEEKEEDKIEKLQNESPMMMNASLTNESKKQKISSPQLLKIPPKLPNYQLPKQFYTSPKMSSPTPPINHEKGDKRNLYSVDQQQQQQQLSQEINWNNYPIIITPFKNTNQNKKKNAIGNLHNNFNSNTSDDDQSDSSENENNNYNYRDDGDGNRDNEMNDMILETPLQSDYSKLLSPIPEENLDKNSLSQSDYPTLSQSQQQQQHRFDNRKDSNSTPEIPQGEESCEAMLEYILRVEGLVEKGNNLYEIVKELVDNSFIEVQSHKFRLCQYLIKFYYF